MKHSSLIRHICALTAFVFLIQPVFAAGVVHETSAANGSLIQSIKAEMQNINKHIKKSREGKKTLFGLSDEGAELQYYSNNDKIIKMTMTYYSEIGKLIEDYYYQNEKLIYVYSRMSRYNKPFGKIIKKDENRYYFSQYNMIQWEENNKVLLPGAKGFGKKQNELIESSKQLMKYSKLPYKCVAVTGNSYSPCANS